MPQKPLYDEFGFRSLDDISSQKGYDEFGFRPLEPPAGKSKSFAEETFTWPNAVRFGMSTAGDLAAPFTFGTSPFIGGAAGEGIARWMEDQPFDPAIMALEGGLNYLPGAGKFERGGLKAIGKYALKSAGHGAAQGAVGTFPRHQAAEGNLLSPTKWEMPSAGEFVGQTIAGGAIGGLAGGVVGGYGHWKAGHSASAPLDLHFSSESGQEPHQLDLGLEGDLRQPELPFPPRFRGPGDREVRWMDEPYLPYNEGPQQGELPLGPPTDEHGQGQLFDMSRPFAHPTPDVETPPAPAPTSEGPVIKSNWTQADIVHWKSRGYVPGGVDPATGYSQMVPGPRGTSPAPPVVETPPTTTGSNTTFNEDEGFTFPRELITPEKVKSLEAQGMRKVGEDTKGNSIFKRFFAEDEGTFDPQEMWQNLKNLFKRDPTDEEVSWAMSRQVRPGEQTGRVAEFDRGFIPEENQNPAGSPPVDPAALEQFSRGLHASTGEPQLGDPLPDFPRDEFGNIIPGKAPTTPEEVRAWYDKQAEIQGPSTYDPFADMPGPEDPRWTENQGLNVGGIRQQNVLGPHAVGPEDMPVMPEMGQQELPWSRGQADQPIDADATARQVTAAADRFKTPMIQEPEQLSMIDTFVDAELDSFLRGEDGTPPEMIDLSEYRPTGIIDQIKDLTKRFLTEESGEQNIGEIMRRLRASLETAHARLEGMDATTMRRNSDINEIRNTTDVREAEDIARFWDLEVRRTDNSPDEVKHVNAMQVAARSRLSELEQLQPSVQVHPEETRLRAEAERYNQSAEYWETQRARYETEGDTEGVRRTAVLRDVVARGRDRALAQIDRRGWESVDTSVEPESHWLDASEGTFEPDIPVGETRPDIEDLRAATGVPNPPITFGLQPVEKGASVRPTKEQVARLRESGDPSAISRQERSTKGRPQYERREGTWDRWATQFLAEAGDGPPGLSIEDKSWSTAPGRTRNYHVVYRGPDGRPITVAKVTEDGVTGVRNVGILASDRFRGMLSGRASHAVFQALLKMNAAEASGSISNYTARMMAKAAKFIKEDAGSYHVGKIVENLLQFKRDLLGGRPLRSKKLTSPEDLTNLLDKMAGDTSSSESVEGGSQKKASLLREAYDFSRGVTTILDLSASLRQGLPLAFSKEWRTSFGKQLKALGSEKAYQKSLSDIRKRELFQSKVDFNTGKIQKSFAEQAGIKLMDVSGAGPREEAIAGNWIGKIPGARASNRAYTAFLNQLRADTFETLINDSSDLFKSGAAGAKDPHTDLTFAKEIADFVNTATGRGPLKTSIGRKEFSLEQNAKLLTDVLFSPRLIASRIRMLNPSTYAMASPFVRKQYLKAALTTATTWTTIATLAKMAGAEVSLDTNSADFGKIKIGNTRIDPGGGFQQFLVSASRLLTGKTTSSATQREFELGQGYRADTRGDIAQRFVTNKLHPVLKFANDLIFASERQPFNVGDRILQLFTPLIMQDVMELAKEDPRLLSLIPAIATGMGTQTYEKGETRGKVIPPEYDLSLKGGAPTNPFSRQRPRPF